MAKKYINAEKLITKIVELRKELPNTIEHLNDEESGFARGQQYELTAIEAEILCLQQEQPEVDLEKEIDGFYGMYRKDGKTYDIEDGEECVDWKEMCNPYFEIEFARHFYELGKNSK